MNDTKRIEISYDDLCLLMFTLGYTQGGMMAGQLEQSERINYDEIQRLQDHLKESFFDHR